MALCRASLAPLKRVKRRGDQFGDVERFGPPATVEAGPVAALRRLRSWGADSLQRVRQGLAPPREDGLRELLEDRPAAWPAGGRMESRLTTADCTFGGGRNAPAEASGDVDIR